MFKPREFLAPGREAERFHTRPAKLAFITFVLAGFAAAFAMATAKEPSKLLWLAAGVLGLFLAAALYELIWHWMGAPHSWLLDRRGLWRGRGTHPKLKLSWHELSGWERKEDSDSHVYWVFQANGRTVRVNASEIDARPETEFEQAIGRFATSQAAKDTASGVQLPAVFKPNVGQQVAGLIFLIVFVAFPVGATWGHHGFVRIGALLFVAIPALMALVMAWRLLASALFGPLMIEVDTQGIWHTRGERRTLVVPWAELREWRATGSDRQSRWKFVTAGRIVRVSGDQVASPSAAQFHAAIELASGRPASR